MYDYNQILTDTEFIIGLSNAGHEGDEIMMNAPDADHPNFICVSFGSLLAAKNPLLAITGRQTLPLPNYICVSFGTLLAAKNHLLAITGGQTLLL